MSACILRTAEGRILSQSNTEGSIGRFILNQNRHAAVGSEIGTRRFRKTVNVTASHRRGRSCSREDDENRIPHRREADRHNQTRRCVSAVPFAFSSFTPCFYFPAPPENRLYHAREFEDFNNSGFCAYIFYICAYRKCQQFSRFFSLFCGAKSMAPFGLSGNRMRHERE